MDEVGRVTMTSSLCNSCFAAVKIGFIACSPCI